MILNQSLIDALNTNYAIEVSELIPLSLGADINACVYKASTFAGESYFVKLKRGSDYDLSLVLLDVLQDSVQNVIPSIQTLHGGHSCAVAGGFTLAFYPFIEGQNGFIQELTPNQWVSLGKALKQVHEFDVPPSIKALIRKETYSSQIRELVGSMTSRIDEISVDDETALKLQAFIKRHRDVIKRLVNRADFLSKLAQEQSSEFVLCHSDIHAGNVLIEEKGSIYIVDWDEPIMAPKERDLMFIGAGVGNVWNKLEEETLFYKGYGEAKINRVILAYYRHERIVNDVLEYINALLLSADEKKQERIEMYRQFVEMFEPRGVVDMAFKTDEAFTLG